jgi:hypothetical protein
LTGKTAKTPGAPRFAKKGKLDRIYRIDGMSFVDSCPANPVDPV